MERDTAGREIRGSHAVQGARQEGSSLVEQKAAGGGRLPSGKKESQKYWGQNSQHGQHPFSAGI